MTNFARLTNSLWAIKEKQSYLDNLNKYSLLVIDDFAAERDTEYMNEMVFQVIDARYRSGLPLIITTNLTARELKTPNTVNKQRVYGRILEMCYPIEVKGKRLKKNTIANYGDMQQVLFGKG
jgi:DNA replication protein DnaC